MKTRAPTREAGPAGPEGDLRQFPELARPVWLRYGAAFLASAIALLVTGRFWSFFRGIPFMPSFLAVFVAGAFGGGGPSFFATALCAAGLAWIVVPSGHPLGLVTPEDWLKMGLFLLVACLVSYLNARLWQTKRQRVRLIQEARGFSAEAHRLAAIVTSSDDAIIAKDLDGIITAWNDGAERLFGYRPDEILGKPVSTLMPPDETGGMNPILDRIRKGDHIEHFDTVRMKKNGEAVAVSLSVSPIRDTSGKIVGASKIARDITERKRTQEAIQNAQRQLALALSAARMGSWVWDIRTGKIDWSEKLEEIHGFAPGTFPGTYESFLGRVHPEDRAMVDEGVRRAIEERSTYDVEFRVPFSDGSTHWVAGHGRVFADETGAPARMIGIGLDITERKAAEVERERLFHEAEEAVKVRDAFISVAGHEFRTPLGALTLTLHNLARKAELEKDDRTLTRLRAVQAQVERLVRLTDDLLEVSRINAGRLSLEPEPTDLSGVVHEVAQRLEETARREGSSVELTCPAPVIGLWDRSRLDQVVTNLLTNAIKFGQRQPIEVTVDADADTARLTVRDRGIGISPEDHARIFERFERAVSGSSYRGIGLGLWIVRQIVQHHNGTITVESEAGKGATFVVQLPLRGISDARPDS